MIPKPNFIQYIFHFLGFLSGRKLRYKEGVWMHMESVETAGVREKVEDFEGKVVEAIL